MHDGSISAKRGTLRSNQRSRSILKPLLSPSERTKCFKLIRGEHWTTEHDGRTERKVKMAGAHAMPGLFCLETNYEETARIILGIRERMNDNLRRNKLINTWGARRIRRKGFYFDFATIDYISPAAALVFAAEYDRARCFLKSWALKLYNRPAWKDSVVHKLEQLGFFSLLDFPIAPFRIEEGQLQITRLHQSDSIDQQQAHGFLAELGRLMGVDDDVNQKIGKLRLYEAIVEATENVTTHAYDPSPPRDEFVVKRWWMTGAVDRGEGRLTIVVYDQGATIPARLPDSLLWHEKLQRFSKRLFGTAEGVRSSENDGKLLRLAMTKPASSTKKAHRGKGLGVLKSVAEQCVQGRLLVISRNGEYVYKSGHRPMYRQLVVPFYGTLIQWDLWQPEWKLLHE